LERPPEERESVDAAIRHVEFLDAEIAAAEKLIAQQALSWPEKRAARGYAAPLGSLGFAALRTRAPPRTLSTASATVIRPGAVLL
jgi:hypothetical protein